MALVDAQGNRRSDNPQSELRAYFSANEMPVDTLEFLFGDFERDAVARLERVDIAQDSEDAWCPLRAEPNDGSMQLYATLVKRVSGLRGLLCFEKSCDFGDSVFPPEITMALQLWLDAHFALMLCYEQGRCRSDDQVRALGAEVLPSLERIFDQGQLPDILFAFMNSDFWEKKKPSNKNPLISIITKAHPLRCQIRGLAKTLHKKCAEDTTMQEFWIAFMLASTLGVYSNSTTQCIGFWERKALYALLLLQQDSTRAKQCVMRWIDTHSLDTEHGKPKEVYEHQNTIMLMLREFVMFSIDLLPGLKRVIQIRYMWSEFERDIVQSANTMRTMIRGNAAHVRELCRDTAALAQPERAAELLDRLFAGVEDMLKSASSSKSFDLYKPRPDDFFTVGLQKLNFYEEKALAEGLEIPPVPEHLLSVIRRVVRAHDPLLDFRVSESVPKRPCDIDSFVRSNTLPIKCFGLAQEDAHRLCDAFSIYPKFKERCVGNMIESLSDPQQVAIVHAIFREVQAHRAVALLPLPAHIYLQQVAAVKQKYDIAPQHAIPHNIGTFLICTNCKSFKGMLSKPKKTRDASKPPTKKDYQYYFLGNQDVIVDDDTGKLYCHGKKKKSDASTKKQQRQSLNAAPVGSQLHEKTLREQNAKAIKLQRKNALEAKCPDTELVRVPMLGQALKFFGKLYMICPTCATPMEYEWIKFAGGQLSCKNCPSKEMLRSDVRCVYCNMVETNDIATQYEIVDDRNDSARRSIVHLCKKCNKAAEEALATASPMQDQEDMTLSELVLKIKVYKENTSKHRIKV